jgi:hypothetical protein
VGGCLRGVIHRNKSWPIVKNRPAFAILERSY